MSTTRIVQVARKWDEAEGIVGFELEGAAGEPLPAFSAGSHIDVRIPGGLVRQYSLSRQHIDGGRYEIAVLREVNSRGGSEALCSRVSEGDRLEISDPRNHFPLQHADHTLLFAGGIGVTPIVCMAERLSVTGASFELHYCTRSRAKTAFLGRIAASSYARHAFLHLDDGETEQKLNLAATLSKPDPQTHLYVCGPAGFLELIRLSARQHGWPETNVHFEYFSAPSEQSVAPNNSFEVTLASNRLSVTVSEGETVVDALARLGVCVPVSCEQGVCGTCLTRIIEGEPDHRDYFLSDAERATNTQFLPCCSRSKSRRLVLDL